MLLGDSWLSARAYVLRHKPVACAQPLEHLSDPRPCSACLSFPACGVQSGMSATSLGCFGACQACIRSCWGMLGLYQGELGHVWPMLGHVRAC